MAKQPALQVKSPFRGHWVQRVLRILAACIVLLGLIQIRGCYHQAAIIGYLKGTRDYMAYEKGRTGQWPHDLRGYEQYCGGTYGFHRNEYLGMRIVEKNKDSCLYVVILKDGEFQVLAAAP